MKKNGYIIENCSPNCPRAAQSWEALEEQIKLHLDTLQLTTLLNQKFKPLTYFNMPKINLAGCPNGCSQPLIKDFGITGFITPMVETVNLCLDCNACVVACSEKALNVSNGSVNIDYSLCISCGDCLRVCTSGTLRPSERGWNLYLGGRVGRHPHFAELFGKTQEDGQIVKWIIEILKDYVGFCPPEERLSHFLESYTEPHFEHPSTRKKEL